MEVNPSTELCRPRRDGMLRETHRPRDHRRSATNTAFTTSKGATKTPIPANQAMNRIWKCSVTWPIGKAANCDVRATHATPDKSGVAGEMARCRLFRCSNNYSRDCPIFRMARRSSIYSKNLLRTVFPQVTNGLHYMYYDTRITFI